MEKRHYWITLLLLFSVCYLGKTTPHRLQKKDKTSISIEDVSSKESTKKLSKRQKRKERKMGLGLQIKLRLMTTFIKRIKKRKAKKEGQVKKTAIIHTPNSVLVDSLTHQQIIETSNYNLAKVLKVKNRIKTRSFFNAFRKRLKKMRRKNPSSTNQKIAKKDLLGHLNNRALSAGEMAHYAGFGSILSLGLALVTQLSFLGWLSFILLGVSLIALIIGLIKGDNVGWSGFFLALGTWITLIAIIWTNFD